MDQQQNTVLKLSNNILEALKWIDSQQNFLVKHLITWSEINSGSTNYTGLNNQENEELQLWDLENCIQRETLCRFVFARACRCSGELKGAV